MTTAAVSTKAGWGNTGYFLEETKDLLTKCDGIGDVCDLVANISEWTHEATGSEKAHQVGATFEVAETAFAAPGLVEQGYNTGKHLVDGEYTKAFQSGLLVGVKGAKTAKFFNSAGLPLLENLKIANGVMWSCLGVFDLFNIYGNVKEAHELNKKYNSATEADKSLLNHRFWIACLSVVKAVNCVAQACIALVGILFASIATGIIFNPLVFLALTTTWLTLNFGIHYYEKFVDKWEKEAAKPLPQHAVKA